VIRKKNIRRKQPTFGLGPLGGVGKFEDAKASGFQTAQRGSIGLPQLLETGALENRGLLRGPESALGAGALPSGVSVDSTI
jgi:hypothetical protein